MMDLLKSVIRRTPLQSVARRIYKSLRPISQNDIYDGQTVEVMKRHLKNDSVCIDIGAHLGDILKEMIALAPKGVHFGFEPLPYLAKSLRKRFPQARVYDLALSDSCGEVEFQHVVNAPAYSGLRQRVYDRPNPKITTIVVRTDRLDNIIPSDSRVSFIKIDIEGAEYLAMRGGVETIKRSRPLIVFEAGKKGTSCYGITPDQIFSFLENECQLQVSTMERWLQGRPPFSLQEFCDNFNQALDYYFIAYP